MTPHNIAFVALGTGLLWFGWFGFNGGSALAANGIAATAFINTDIAGSIAMVTWLLISWKFEKKPTLIGTLTGAVAGLSNYNTSGRICKTLGCSYHWNVSFYSVLFSSAA